MFSPAEYELLDFGRGRKLERFGPLVLDRPSPSADPFEPADRAAWRAADACYERTTGERGVWTPADAFPADWSIAHGPLRLALKPTDFGHVGVFAEQQANWDWLTTVIAHAARPLKILNLFAYTGGSTLAAAAAGAQVTHIDAARNVVDWARANARLSSLDATPIRWIAEDALKFVRREVRRGNRYDGVILDPPSYGHGPQGEVWQIAEHLPELLALCGELVERQPALVLATCHSPQLTTAALAAEVREKMASALPAAQIALEAEPLTLRDAHGRHLPSGIVVRLARV